MMDEFAISLGQRTLPSVHHEQTIATTYAGLGLRHLLIVADGSVGEIPSRLAAQTACAAALARIRASVLPDLRATLIQAFDDAHAAVRRVLLGTIVEGKGQSALLAVLISDAGITAARLGGGRVVVLNEHGQRSLFGPASPQALGAGPPGSFEPEIVQDLNPLTPGDRIIILSESAVRPVVADLANLTRDTVPQLGAGRIAEAARRRGQLDPLSVHIVEISGSPTREGPHPALIRLDRSEPKTFDPDGYLLTRPSPHAVRQRREKGGYIILFFIAAALGAAVAIGPSLLSVPDDHPMALTPTDAPEPLPEPLIDLDALEHAQRPPARTQPPEPEPPPEIPEPIARLLEPSDPQEIARGLRQYITTGYAERREAVFTELEAALEASAPEPKLIEALLILLEDRKLRQTKKWIQDLLPRLYARQADDL